MCSSLLDFRFWDAIQHHWDTLQEIDGLFPIDILEWIDSCTVWTFLEVIWICSASNFNDKMSLKQPLLKVDMNLKVKYNWTVLRQWFLLLTTRGRHTAFWESPLYNFVFVFGFAFIFWVPTKSARLRRILITFWFYSARQWIYIFISLLISTQLFSHHWTVAQFNGKKNLSYNIFLLCFVVDWLARGPHSAKPATLVGG